MINNFIVDMGSTKAISFPDESLLDKLVTIYSARTTLLRWLI